MMASINIIMVIFAFLRGMAGAELANYELRCLPRNCYLESKQEGDDSQIKITRSACVNEDCSRSLAISDSKHLFECQVEASMDVRLSLLSSVILQPSSASSRRVPTLLGRCQKLTKTPVGEALVQLAIKEVNNRGAFLASSSEESDDSKRELPFETMNYGKKKRQLPFETLNYGKRTIETDRHQKCNCNDYKRETGLPFDSILLGKKSLPFETLNYGKRSDNNYREERSEYIPIDGYIMGKRTDV